jgi:hypothetical protein
MSTNGTNVYHGGIILVFVLYYDNFVVGVPMDILLKMRERTDGQNRQNQAAFYNWPEIWEPYLWIWNILTKSHA